MEASGKLWVSCTLPALKGPSMSVGQYAGCASQAGWPMRMNIFCLKLFSGNLFYFCVTLHGIEINYDRFCPWGRVLNLVSWLSYASNFWISRTNLLWRSLCWRSAPSGNNFHMTSLAEWKAMELRFLAKNLNMVAIWGIPLCRFGHRVVW